MPAPAAPPGRRLPALVLGLALPVVALSGCGSLVLDGDVEEAYADMAWVVDAHSECHELACTVEADLEADSEPGQIVEALEAALDLDADDVVLRVGRHVTAEISRSSPGAVAEPLAEVLAWGAASPDVGTLEVAARAGDQVVTATAPDAGGFWSTGRAVWDGTASLPDRWLRMTDREGRPGDRHLAVGAEATPPPAFPAGPVEVAQHLEEQSLEDRSRGEERAGTPPLRLSGIAVVQDALLVGVGKAGDVAAAQAAVDSHPARPTDPPAAVVVTTTLLELAEKDPAGRSDSTALSAALAGLPEVAEVTHRAYDVEVRLAGGILQGRAVVAQARRRADEAFRSNPLVLRTADGRAEATMLHGGDDSLLVLGARLQETVPGGSTLEVHQRDGKPPYLSLEVPVPGPTDSAPALAPRVSEMARVVVAHRGSSSGYHLGLKVVGSTGRSASVDWKVEVTPEGPQVVEVGVLEDQDAMVRRAWSDGL